MLDTEEGKRRCNNSKNKNPNNSIFSFERPAGAAKDLRELEYVSALHQTDEQIRKDASIKAIDIATFLRSRYDIKVSEEEVRSTICHGFAGGDEDDEVLDLSEMISILLIPYLVNESRNPNRSKHIIGGASQGASLVKQVEWTRLLNHIFLSNNKSNSNSPIKFPDVEAEGEASTAKDIFDRVLDMILEDVIGFASEHDLNINLLSKIFLYYEEQAIAFDYSLLDEMVQSVKASSSGESERGGRVKLTKENFIKALTNDVLMYSEENGENLPLMLQQRRNEDKEEIDPEAEHKVIRNLISQCFQKISSTFSIDPTTEAYFSRTFVVIIWSLFLTSYFAYVYLLSETKFSICENQPPICHMGEAILNWTILLLGLVCFGMIFVGLGSMGNHANIATAIPLIASLVTIFLASFPPFLILYYLDFTFTDEPSNSFSTISNSTRSGEEVLQEEKYVGYAYQRVAYFSSFFLAIIAILLMLFRLCFYFKNNSKLHERVGVPSASTHKITCMINNAKHIHDSCESDKDGQSSYSTRAIFHFIKTSGKKKVDGGFFWTWKEIISRRLLTRHGIRVPVRVLAGNFSLIFISAFIISAGIYLIRYVDATYGENHQEFLSQKVVEFLDVQQQSVSNETMSQIQNELQKLNLPLPEEQKLAIEEIFYQQAKNITLEASMKSFSYLYPEEKSMVIIPLKVLTAVSFVTSIYLFLLYIPSTVSLIIRMRFGVIPTLQEPYFAQLRTAPDLSTMVIGSMFWGSLYSSVLVGGFFSLLVFLFLWQITRQYAFAVLFYLIGFLIALIFKIVTLVCLRKSIYMAFYRKVPTTANLMELALECWSIGFTTGTIFIRAIKLTLATLVYIGRMDAPFLAPRVGVIGAFDIDPIPSIFRRSLLAYEAHNHPYIETLGTLYVLKLHYGKKFGTRAGSCWRLLFTTALMPWVRQYRVMTRSGNIFIPHIMGDTTYKKRFSGETHTKVISEVFATNRNQGIEEGDIVEEDDYSGGGEEDEDENVNKKVNEKARKARMRNAEIDNVGLFPAMIH